MKRVKDNHPAELIKDLIIARSGVYEYTYDEMLARGIKPKVVKPIYRELRPADVLVRNKDKFGLVIISKEHTEEETNADNFRDEGQVSGVIGDNISVVPMDDGEIGLKAKGAFYTKDGVDYLNQGNRETSADYQSTIVPSDDPRYDYILKDIVAVNGVAITARGRGGSSVRVLDSASASSSKNHGGCGMNILSLLGLSRTTDNADFKLSKVVFDGIDKVNKIDRTKDAKGYLDAIESEVGVVNGFLTQLKDNEYKAALTSLVKDSFSGPMTDIVANKEKISKAIDGLYGKARTKDAEEIKKTLDEAMAETEDSEEEKAKKKKEKEDKEKEDKEKGKSDEERVKDAIDKALTRVTDSLPDLVAKAVASKLGITQETQTTSSTKDSLQAQIEAQVAKVLGGDVSGSADTRTVDSMASNEEAAFLLRSTF